MAQQTNHIGDTDKTVTVVDWFWSKLCNEGYFRRLPVEEYHQAIEIHKEQITKAYELGQDKGYEHTPEQYYNRAFKTKTT